MIAGLDEIGRRYTVPPSHVSFFTHGTTVGVNTAIQRRAAALALFTTAGFEDILVVARLKCRIPTPPSRACVQRRVARYIAALQNSPAESGVPAEPMITKSNDGIMAAGLGKTDAVAMLLSGTASGVIEAADIARRIGAHDVFSFDVGGTSANVAVIRDGAGGGSIAWVDEFGVFKVGSESAGSDPRPACDGRVGTRATLTDAFAVLGLLGAAELAYGAVRLDQAAARAVGGLGERLGFELEETAESIIRIAGSGMYLRVVKLMSRHDADPRGFALLALGGAGPMTARLLARELGAAQVVVPPTPGVLSAYCGLCADIRNDFIRTVFLGLDACGLTALAPRAEELERETQVFLDGIHRDDGLYERARLRPGRAFSGPALVAQDDRTTVVRPGFTAEVDAWGNVVIRAED